MSLVGKMQFLRCADCWLMETRQPEIAPYPVYRAGRNHWHRSFPRDRIGLSPGRPVVLAAGLHFHRRRNFCDGASQRMVMQRQDLIR